MSEINSAFWKTRYLYLQRFWRHFAKLWELIVVGILGLLAVAVWPIPQWMVRREYWQWNTHPADYARLVDDYRKAFVQIIGGAFLLYTLYLTQRRTKASEETLRISQEMLGVAQETQVTDRFTKAIGQLGATNTRGDKQIETRLGAIYSLERIAKDSWTDHWPIMEILTAYVRQNARRQDPGVETSLERSPPAEDIQAIMTVLGRRAQSRKELSFLNLSGANLRKLYFHQGNLTKAYLEKADLEGAYLTHANLKGAYLGDVNLSGAYLDDADLEGAILDSAALNDAKLSRANLKGATLKHACLDRAILVGTHLEGADLSNAQLVGAELKETHFDNAAFGGHTSKGLFFLKRISKGQRLAKPSYAEQILKML